ncbi:MAG: PAS domain S-box protein [Chitinophagaceae bacterium]|nr:PAS domain S-box protein [Chitinophagaceae bacterium]
MPIDTLHTNNLQKRIEELELQLAEAYQSIEAIRDGEIDAYLINDSQNRNQVYTLAGGDHAYRILIEKVSEGAINVTEEGTILFANTYFLEMAGMPYEKLAGTSIFNLISNESRNQFEELFTKARTGNDKGEIILSINDRPVPVYVSLTSLQPHFPAIGMIVTDLREKKSYERIINTYQHSLEKANEDLANKNKSLERRIVAEFSESFSQYKIGTEFFEALVHDLAIRTQVDHILIGELVKTRDGHHAIQTLAVCSFEETDNDFEYDLAGGPCDDLFTRDTFIFPENCQSLFPNNKTIHKFEVEGYLGCTLYDLQEQPVGIIALMHTKSIQEIHYAESLMKIAGRRAEMELDRLNKDKILEAKNLELERQNAELASFTYIASHDLQEPLRKIQAFSTRLVDQELENISEIGKDYFARITSAASRMQHLIKALLSYSRTNSSESDFLPTDLNHLLDEVKMELKEEIEETGATIESNELPVLNLVPLQFHQLMMNLILNSIKYRREDAEPRIRIRAELVTALPDKEENNETNSKFWKLSFEDNGIGFEQKYAGKIFDLFQRLHGRAQYEGTGIGLAICKKIVQHHHGFIAASGRPGNGATFSLFLPAPR